MQCFKQKIKMFFLPPSYVIKTFSQFALSQEDFLTTTRNQASAKQSHLIANKHLITNKKEKPF